YEAVGDLQHLLLVNNAHMRKFTETLNSGAAGGGRCAETSSASRRKRPGAGPPPGSVSGPRCR
ncbi:hypothetical protein ACWEK7_33115, partial [Streptomyces californicus]